MANFSEVAIFFDSSLDAAIKSMCTDLYLQSDVFRLWKSGQAKNQAQGGELLTVGLNAERF